MVSVAAKPVSAARIILATPYENSRIVSDAAAKFNWFVETPYASSIIFSAFLIAWSMPPTI